MIRVQIRSWHKDCSNTLVKHANEVVERGTDYGAGQPARKRGFRKEMGWGEEKDTRGLYIMLHPSFDRIPAVLVID